MQTACVIVPAFDAERTLGAVIADVRQSVGLPIIVVDDGSSDGTRQVAEAHDVVVLRHDRNRGKGAAIRSGLLEAARRGYAAAVTVDADGQHPGGSVAIVLHGSDALDTLVLGVRDLARDGAPRSNRFGNGVANFFLSSFSGRSLRDTQCGLRRYPVQRTLDLGTRADGFAFEGEVVLRAVAAKVPIVEISVSAVYGSEGSAQSHFRRVVDPTRIVFAVVRTVLELELKR